MTQDEKSSILNYIAQIKSSCEGVSYGISDKIVDGIRSLDDTPIHMFDVAQGDLEKDALSVADDARDMERTITEFENFVDGIDCSEEEDSWDVYGTDK
jgi:hypothetical protein|nr:MAG TPA: hypothetical protein [Caudoviricetes sp.]